MILLVLNLHSDKPMEIEDAARPMHALKRKYMGSASGAARCPACNCIGMKLLLIMTNRCNLVAVAKLSRQFAEVFASQGPFSSAATHFFPLMNLISLSR